MHGHENTTKEVFLRGATGRTRGERGGGKGGRGVKRGNAVLGNFRTRSLVYVLIGRASSGEGGEDGDGGEGSVSERQRSKAVLSWHHRFFLCRSGFYDPELGDSRRKRNRKNDEGRKKKEKNR